MRLNKTIQTSIFFLSLTGAAAGMPVLDSETNQLPEAAPSLLEADAQIAPIAFLRFCRGDRSLCEPRGRAGRMELTQNIWAQLQAVNTAINARIAPDPAKGAFDWSLEATSGNCNDYAVQKQKALVEGGYPLAALALTVAITPWGEGHLVLTVRTDRGDFVLDNLTNTVLAWDRTDYRWLKRQSPENPQVWVAMINNGGAGYGYQ